MRVPEALIAAGLLVLGVITFFIIPGVGIVLALIAMIVGVTAVVGAHRIMLFAGAVIGLAGVVVIPTIHPIAGIVIMLAGGAICGTAMLMPSFKR